MTKGIDKKTAASLAAIAALAAGALSAFPAGAHHGPGLRQAASVALDAPATRLGTVCFGTCQDIVLPPDTRSIALELDYTLTRTEAHLPDVVAAAGLPEQCVRDGVKRSGAVVDLGAGSFQSLNGASLVVTKADGTKETIVTPPGGGGSTIDPPALTYCVL